MTHTNDAYRLAPYNNSIITLPRVAIFYPVSALFSVLMFVVPVTCKSVYFTLIAIVASWWICGTADLSIYVMVYYNKTTYYYALTELTDAFGDNNKLLLREYILS